MRQKEAKGLVVLLAVGTPALRISTVAWPPQCGGLLINGLVRPKGLGRWGTALSDGIRISVLDS